MELRQSETKSSGRAVLDGEVGYDREAGQLPTIPT